jgi:hypothetical protein
MTDLNRIIFPLPNPLPPAGEGATVGLRPPRAIDDAGETF